MFNPKYNNEIPQKFGHLNPVPLRTSKSKRTTQLTTRSIPTKRLEKTPTKMRKGMTQFLADKPVSHTSSDNTMETSGAAVPQMDEILRRTLVNPGVSLRDSKSSKPKHVKINAPMAESSLLGGLDPLKWFHRGLETKDLSGSLNRNPAKLHIGPYNPKGILDTDESEKLITVGGYIINLERNTPQGIKTVIRPRVSSQEVGMEVEVRVTGVDPKSIKVQKRYNAIIVIGVQENGLVHPDIHKAMGQDVEKFPKFEDELLELVNIFVPRDISLARVTISKPDSKGRIVIRTP